MKPHFHLIQKSNDFPYLAKRHTLPNFGSTWHYHPEIEIHHVIRGEGVRFIGENISNFNSGELLLLGENLPHMWRCNKEYFEGNKKVTAEASFVQFLPNFMGDDFLEKKEAQTVLALYERARSGLIVYGKTKERILDLLYEAVGNEGLKRMMNILNMVNILSASNELKKISSGITLYQSSDYEMNRINNIYQYILTNYRNEISLEEIASIAHLNKNSFCRYFKMITKRTFREFLIEVRISHAKR